MERTQPHETEANFSIEEYGAKTAEKEECEEQLLTEYATLLGLYLASAVLRGALVRHSSEFRSAFRSACDAVLRWDFGKRNRLGFSPPRAPSA